MGKGGYNMSHGTHEVMNCMHFSTARDNYRGRIWTHSHLPGYDTCSNHFNNCVCASVFLTSSFEMNSRDSEMAKSFPL